MDGLDGLHCADGVLLDGFIEKTFAWDLHRGDSHGLTAYQEPWVGFVHNPPHVPAWFNTNRQSPTEILHTPSWQQSMAFCKGLFTLSSHLKNWLAPQVPVLVCNLLAPTETPENRFTTAKYLLNGEKKIIQIGWWLRKFSSLYDLPVTNVKKVLLSLGDHWTDDIHRTELGFVRDRSSIDSVRIVPYLCNDEYDELLSKNLVFLDLYDSSFNNAIVECIVRATPVLVNPLPAVIEYLGKGYPFYFETLDQAGSKAEDEALVVTTHQYLEAHPLRRILTREHFLQSFVESEIYRGLPLPPSGMRRAAQKDHLDRHETNRTAGSAGSCEPAISVEERIAKQLMNEWNRSLDGDGQSRAHWRLVEGDGWSWEGNALCAGHCNSEWSAYQYSRCDPPTLRALKKFVVEVTVSGSGGAAGLSFGPYKDFLVELDPADGERHLRLEVDSSSDTWVFRVDGEPAERCWWDSSVRDTADLVGGTLAFKARRPKCARFRNLSIHAFQLNAMCLRL